MRATSLSLVLALGLLASACQSAPSRTAVSIEDARQVGASFGATFMPPPRTIDDITAILDESRDDAHGRAILQAMLLDAPPTRARLEVLAEFHRKRGLAAGLLGRADQEIDDLTRALVYGLRTVSPLYMIRFNLAMAERQGGNSWRAIEHFRLGAGIGRRAVIRSVDGVLIPHNALLAIEYASIGDIDAADTVLEQTETMYHHNTLPGGNGTWLQWSYAMHRSLLATAQAVLLNTTGHHAEAEALCRKVIAQLDGDRRLQQHPWLDEVHSYLAFTLIPQRRLPEAENEARSAARGALAKRGRFSPHTAWMLRSLVSVLLEQERYREAEALARVVVDIYERTGTAPESLRFAAARADLATALESQGRDRESLREYDVIRDGLSRDPASLRRFFDGHVRYAELLLKTGAVESALGPLTVALQESRRLVGDSHRQTAQIRGSLARAYAANGEVNRALDEFGEAVPTLLKRLSESEDEGAPSRKPDPRFVATLGAYIGLLADMRGTPRERTRGIDATAEAFRLADAARARAVQRAVDANAVRAAVHRPGLAEVVRRKQDTKQEIAALYDRLADALSEPRPEQDTKLIAELRNRVEARRAVLTTLTTQVETEFPAYAELVNPKPVTLARARAMLQPGEALIATLVTRDRTFVWAVPHAGPVAFAAPPIGAGEIETTVATLRKALEPGASTLGDIPDFDLALAHRLYSALLEPVRAGWQDARVVFVVTDGALGQLPLAVLPTAPAALPPESGALFSSYRHVPWLARTHAVVVLPSVGSLAALRALPPGGASRRPFVGFGDPWFSHEQAALAAAGGATRPREAAALTTRSMPLTLRNAPRTFDSSDLHRLPPLPETAEEIQSIAGAMRADPERDVFVGARANEEAVKTLDLAGYRVIAFATHGLVAGDLHGLTQPALALSAPDVVGVDGDGLLTLDEILALRLNADWIVLSACNTAAGDGAGADAVSGLGRAFFYAGARALLVSNWPVETTSARALTTQLFRQPAALSRAEALQATMKWMIDEAEFVDGPSGKIVFSYAHPIFWAPFTLVGDGGGAVSTDIRRTPPRSTSAR